MALQGMFNAYLTQAFVKLWHGAEKIMQGVEI